MKFLDNIKAKREIRRILNSDDSDKIDKIGEISEDEEIERIIFSIEDKQKRAKAFEESLPNIDSKDVMKKIIPTLKDDDILKLLRKKHDYLNNEEINILYTTISGIDDLDKRIKAVEMFADSLSDGDISGILNEIKDKKDEHFYEDKKIIILTDRIICNYIKNETIMHIDYLLWCLEDEKSKIEVLKNCLERNRKIEEKRHKLFDTETKITLVNRIFEIVKKDGKNNSLDRKKVDIVFTLFKNNEISYEQAREIVEKNIQNTAIIEQTRNALLKLEANKIKVNQNTEIEIEKDLNKIEIDNGEEMEK